MAYVGVAAGQDTLKTNTTGTPAYGKSCARAKPSKFFNGYAYNNHATDTCYFMIFNLTALPANATVPFMPPIACPAGANASFDVWGGTDFDTGVVIAASSTADALTLIAGDTVNIFASVR